jgi:hypothetical protein
MLAGAFSGGKSRLRLGGLLNLFVNAQQVLPRPKVTLESQALRDLVACDYLTLDCLVALVRSLAD